MTRMELDEIINSRGAPEKGDCCVYQLLDDNDIVVYVGQTLNLKKRISQHIDNKKEFSDLLFSIVGRSSASNEEAKLIVNLKPALNKSLPKNDFFSLKSSLKSELASKVSSMIDAIEPDFEIKKDSTWNGKYIHTHNASLIRSIIENATEECLKTKKLITNCINHNN